jgi:hypothetical protein
MYPNDEQTNDPVWHDWPDTSSHGCRIMMVHPNLSGWYKEVYGVPTFFPPWQPFFFISGNTVERHLPHDHRVSNGGKNNHCFLFIFGFHSDPIFCVCLKAQRTHTYCCRESNGAERLSIVIVLYSLSLSLSFLVRGSAGRSVSPYHRCRLATERHNKK